MDIFLEDFFDKINKFNDDEKNIIKEKIYKYFNKNIIVGEENIIVNENNINNENNNENKIK